MTLKAPFPWFGGKRRVAETVWSAIGAVDNYVEPFAGSLAVLLARPDDRWRTGAETVNDADAYLCNFWRALQAAPDEVAKWADWPVNETDLYARHKWLVNTGAERIAALENDPDYCDAKVAGWWVWGLSAWIGSGWCRDLHRQRPHLGDAGMGVHRQLPHIAANGRGVLCSKSFARLRGYMRLLAERLLRVRVCCGDWSRVVTDGALSYGGTVGVFLDPPYLAAVRDADIYRVEAPDLSPAVRQWAIEHGDDPRMRIVLAGYEDEHAEHMPASWRVVKWKGNKCYGSSHSAKAEEGNHVNRHKERLWFSPHCRKPESAEQHVFTFASDGGAR